MRRVVIVVGLLVLTASCVAFAHGRAAPPAFRLGDASAACRYDGKRLACSNLTIGAGLSLAGRGTPRAVSRRVWWDASTPVLRRWTRDGISCRVADGTIFCHNATGASISVDGVRIAVGL